MDTKILQQLSANKDFYCSMETGRPITWCSNCGNYAVHGALKRAVTLENKRMKDFLLCFDIGCSGNGADKIGAYTIKGLHGRTIPVACGASIANQNIKVIGIAGDGATLSEGINHLIHAVRNNYPVVFLLMNNENFALTTGQASTTTPKNTPMKAAPEGLPIPPLNPLSLVLELKATFAARVYTGNIDHMTEIMRSAIKHNGFAFIEVLQHCPTYNKIHTDTWYEERLNYLDNATDLETAKKLAKEIERVHVGIFYQTKNQKNYLENISYRSSYKTPLTQEVKHYDITDFLKPLRE